MPLNRIPSSLRSLLVKSPSIAQLPHKAVLSITGSQAGEFLNGMLASAVPDAPKRPFFSAILNAQGRVLYDLLVFADRDINGRPGYLIEYDSRPSEATPLHDLLKRFVLRSKVKIRDATSEYDSWAAWDAYGSLEGSIRTWQFANSGAIEPIWPNAAEQWPWGTEDRVLMDRRAPGMGIRYLVRKGDRPSITSTHDEVSSEGYTLHRIAHGVPEGIDDISPTAAFPMESNLDVMGALDFRKGCYVGQELTVRTYHTGAVRKRILPVSLQGISGNSLESGLDIKASVLSSEDKIPRPRGNGKLLSLSQGFALALLRLEHVEGVEKKQLELRCEGSTGSLSVEPWWPEWWPGQE
ncbi:mitochondrial protein [Moniliophthora roreri MCA 2997]|uniref:Mitochondrial protein n=2 Tax=Moniliophthora roreri TaxID=221103 RepID=V2Z119_MONRO|nr:mitochondrial protein [Moniliophthora roreri MCA 2997]KAI3612537.1 mitochondrial protein [Moniliophthora roreri]